jgi:hypothetical protein
MRATACLLQQPCVLHALSCMQSRTLSAAAAAAAGCGGTEAVVRMLSIVAAMPLPVPVNMMQHPCPTFSCLAYFLPAVLLQRTHPFLAASEPRLLL